MGKVCISHPHNLGLQKACDVAAIWEQQAQKDYGLSTDVTLNSSIKKQITFFRTGVKGLLTLTESEFLLEMDLGFLYSVYQSRIEERMMQKLKEVSQ